MTIPPETHPGAVRLRVSDIELEREFYLRVIGLVEIESDHPGLVRLGSRGEDGTAIVELESGPDAPPRPPGTSGLFHLAIVYPDRHKLARALRRAIEAEAAMTGASDHLVSEALYLNDAEGNGIELYRDRPRGEWQRVDGKVQISSLALDVRSLLAEAEGDDAPSEVEAGTRIGHVHLNVGDLEAARAFYIDTLGFEVTVDDYPGALFVAAGDYHHHIGLNTWAGEGAPAPPEGSAGLRWFELVLPDQPAVEDATGRLRDAGIETEQVDGGISVSDPSGNRILLRT